MRAAPPVSLRCSGGRGWRWAQVFLYTLATAALAVWLLQRVGWSVAYALPACALVALLAARLCEAPALDLSWDGRDWRADGVTGRLEVALDLGSALLLRLKPDGGGGWRWLALSRSEAGPAWHGLRVAAYAAPTGPRPPAASDAGR